MVRAYGLKDESRHSLYKSTYGMLFFGTPHRGSPKDDILKMIEQSHPERIPALLQTTPNSDDLMSQLKLFENIIGERPIGGFYETEPTPAPIQVRFALLLHRFMLNGISLKMEDGREQVGQFCKSANRRLFCSFLVMESERFP